MDQQVNLTKVGPVARIVLVGEAHMEEGRLVIGDTDAVKKLWASYGGGRQMVELDMEMWLLTSATVEVSQSGAGLFAETSEPK